MRTAIHTVLGAISLAIISTILAVTAQAGIVARIDKSSQTMSVYVEGSHRYTWSVSTGRGGYNTPTGSYRPHTVKRMHYSSKYHGSPMPYSVFFRGGYAIHGTYDTGRLGRRASHGCVRLSPGNAATFYSLVRSYGSGKTRIVITN